MASIASLLAAAGDQDLQARFDAAAQAVGLGPGWAAQQMGRLVAVETAAGNPADAHAYAVLGYSPSPRPGQNPAAVTDEMIYAAIAAVNGPTGA